MNQFKKALCDYMQRCQVSDMPGAALFDMDGTLYDSMPNHVVAWQHMLSESGISVEPEEILMTEGRTGVDTVRMIFRRHLGQELSDDECRRLYRRKAELFAGMPPVSLVAGAQSLVKAVQEAGMTTVLVTGSGQNSLLGRLEEGFPDAFPEDRRVTAFNVTHGKPHPEPYLRGMEIAGVSPYEAMAFDNAPLGVQSASAAGAFTVGVITGAIPPESLGKAGADIVFASMRECADAAVAFLAGAD